VDAELDTLATALYVKIDDALKDNPGLAPWRPAVGICPKLSDAELLTLCVLQALGGFVSDARFLRHARAHLLGAFPCLPNQPKLQQAGAQGDPPDQGDDQVAGPGHRHVL
jgi:hypothetical protein